VYLSHPVVILPVVNEADYNLDAPCCCFSNNKVQGLKGIRVVLPRRYLQYKAVHQSGRQYSNSGRHYSNSGRQYSNSGRQYSKS
jgi:hypothetical protein